MLSISQRGAQMPSSPIRKLAAYADAAKKQGVKVYHLNIGQPDIETPAIMMDAVRDNHLKILEYTDSVFGTHSKRIVKYWHSVQQQICQNYCDSAKWSINPVRQ